MKNPTPSAHKTSTADVAIIGGGAAGLAAAIAAREHSQSARIYLLDGAKSLGAKILVSGGGRCNVTHDRVTPNDFFGNRHIIRNVLAAFSLEQTIAWLTSLGVELKREDTGKMFPTTDKARTVLNALLARARDSGVTVCPDHRVKEVTRAKSGFQVRHRYGLLHAARLILATGGQSLPKTGSDGFGYRLGPFSRPSRDTNGPRVSPASVASLHVSHATLRPLAGSSAHNSSGWSRS